MYLFKVLKLHLVLKVCSQMSITVYCEKPLNVCVCVYTQSGRTIPLTAELSG